MKKFVALVLFCGLISSGSAIGVGKFKINPEAGILYGLATPTHTSVIGGYARAWLGGSGLTIAPVVKYSYIVGPGDASGYANTHVGALLGYRIFYVTPYIGVSYSGFSSVGFSDTTAFNYGIYLDVPILPFSVGIDAIWQQPRILGSDVRQTQLQTALTLGIIF